VDDNPLVLGLVTRALSEIGDHVTAYASFEAAQAAIARATPDVLMVDIRLDGFNGLQLIAMIRARHPHVRTIAITGFDDRDLRREATVLGATFVLKPITPTRICAAVDDAMSSAA
jgi:DNA-binding NtrC family response regulator